MIRVQPADEALSGPDLTPLIDIIFIMLVFLMLTANPVTHLLSMELPQQAARSAPDPAPPSPLHLALTAEAPHWHLEQTGFASLDQFKTALLSQPDLTDRPIVVAGDKSVPLEPVLQLFSLLQAEGLTQVQFVMEPAS